MRHPLSTKLTLVAVLATSYACSKSAAHGSESHEASEQSAARKVTVSAGVTPVSVNEDGFAPSHIEVAKGQKLTLRFTRTTDKTCATEVTFPELGLTKPLPLNQPVDVEIPSDQARTLTFQCGMGMYKSKIVIL